MAPLDGVLNLDETLLALADPTRRAILRRIVEGEARVTELAKPFEMSLPAVSKHIRVLEKARLVRRRKIGREHYLSFDPTGLQQATTWIETQRALWMARLDRLDEILKEQDRELEKKNDH